MLKSLKLKNFRNFENSEFFFSDSFNIIIGENGKGKTNILEAISLLNLSNISKIEFDNLTKFEEEYFYIETETIKGDKISLSYDKKTNKKKYSYNGKNTIKKKINEKINKSVLFSPILMNIMYLSPSLRRDFLDEILISTFDNYNEIINQYKKILTSRNKILKNIREGKSKENELDFRNEKFALKTSQIYNYRIGLVDFFKNYIGEFTKYFENKISKCDFNYITKIKKNNNLEKKEKLEDTKKQIINHLRDNLQKDIILGKTTIGPHNDDFSILVDGINLTEFASRGEVKSVIIGLKILQIKFIEELTNKKPILIIDDLLSELDEKHKNSLINNMKGYQTFISSIKNSYDSKNNIINL